MKSYSFTENVPASKPPKGSISGGLSLHTVKENGKDNFAFEKDVPQDDFANDFEGQGNQEEFDPWSLVAEIDTGPKWRDMSNKERAKVATKNTVKILIVIGLLYFFVCSLDLLTSAFKLIAGKSASALLDNEYIQNPVVGLMVGILLTVFVQSSSTSTSIIVAMVSAQILTVQEAIYMIMGANIGTSVTNTIVSLTQVGDRNQFRRAFAGATVHDMFNWLAVIVLLPLEVITGMLYKLSYAIVSQIGGGASVADIIILKYITDPFTELIIMLDGDVLDCWGIGMWLDVNTMIVEYCEDWPHNETTTITSTLLSTTSTTTVSSTTTTANSSISTVDPVIASLCTEDDKPSTYGMPDSCHFLFYNTGMTDMQVGIILLVISLFILCTALIVIVKILNSLLKGSIAVVIRKTINADIQCAPWLTGYIAIAIGAVMTFLVQTSTIFTSTLTPLIGIGIITIERAYPLTLGSNIGTTTTALLASLASAGEGLIDALQVALVHLFFNIFAILIYYPIPFMRFPIPMAKYLGELTSQYRWFAVVYLIGMFFLIPVTIFGLSLGGPVVLWSVLGPILIFAVIIIIINVIQNKKKSLLPKKLQNWDWVPEPLRSLRPYDKVMTSLPCCKKCRDTEDAPEPLDEIKVVEGSSSGRSSMQSSLPDKIGVDNPVLSVD